MTLTQAGLAVIVLLIMLARGGVGRLGIVVAALCGASIVLIGSLSDTAWDIAGTIADIGNSFGSGGGNG